MGHSVGIRRVGVSAVLLGAVALSAVVVDPALGAGTATATGNDAPFAEAGLDQQIPLGGTVRLDATGSYDPDGSVVGYEWRIRTPEGTTVAPRDPYAPRTSFPATAVGRYEVALTVTDDDGKAGTDTMYVRVGPGDGDGGSPRSDADGPVPPGEDRPVEGAPRGPSGGRAGVTGADVTAAACSAGRGERIGGCPGAGTASGAGTEPWIRIEGPAVVKSGYGYTYEAETGGLAEGRRYEWEGGDTGRRHTLRFRSSGEYDLRVDVSDGRGATATDTMEVFVSTRPNERPDVEIADPGRVAPGERVRLSAAPTDPDGTVRTVEWSPSRRVRVPDDGSSLTVRVTVTDDDGASVTDAITLTGDAWNRTRVGNDTADSAAHDVTCYFTQARQREGENPHSDRCVVENGNTVSLGVGPSRIESFRRKGSVDLQWRRTNESRLRELEANDTGTGYGVAAGSPYDAADAHGYSADLVRRMGAGGRAAVANDESFALNGRTVEDDLTGDGSVDAADWDQRYRTSGDTSNVDPHADASNEFKRSVRGGPGPGSEGDPLDLSWEATASTVEGPFAGTSIDEENRRDRVAALGPGDPSNANADRDPGADGGGGGSSTMDGGSRTTDGNGSPLLAASGTDDGDTEAPGDDGGSDGGASGSDDEGPSRHDPNGGRVVVRP